MIDGFVPAFASLLRMGGRCLGEIKQVPASVCSWEPTRTRHHWKAAKAF
jgi:hypothetical protein